MLGKDGGHAQAVVQADARCGNQKLHGYLRGNLAGAYLLLNRFREEFHQRQASRYPTGAAVETPRQLFE